VLIGAAWAVSLLFSLPMLFINGVPAGSHQCRISLSSRAQWRVRNGRLGSTSRRKRMGIDPVECCFSPRKKILIIILLLG